MSLYSGIAESGRDGIRLATADGSYEGGHYWAGK